MQINHKAAATQFGVELRYLISNPEPVGLRVKGGAVLPEGEARRAFHHRPVGQDKTGLTSWSKGKYGVVFFDACDAIMGVAGAGPVISPEFIGGKPVNNNSLVTCTPSQVLPGKLGG